MADNYKTPVVRFRDPRIAIENKPVICIDQGAEAIDVRRAPATTYTENTLTFSELSTGGTNMCIDRKIKIEYEYYASLSASGTAADVLYGTATSYPVTAAATAGQVTIDTEAQLLKTVHLISQQSQQQIELETASTESSYYADLTDLDVMSVHEHLV